MQIKLNITKNKTLYRLFRFIIKKKEQKTINQYLLNHYFTGNFIFINFNFKKEELFTKSKIENFFLCLKIFFFNWVIENLICHLKFKSQEIFTKRPYLVIKSQDYSQVTEFTIMTTDDFTKYSQIKIDGINFVDYRRILGNNKNGNKILKY